jgi:fumarate hydratase subunit alpha
MPISSDVIKSVSAQLYERSLKRIPTDTMSALVRAENLESNSTAKHTLRIMIKSAQEAEETGQFVCSDSGIPVYFIQVGTQVQFNGNVREAIREGFEDLVASIQPPLLPHVTHPLTLERGYQGVGMPIVTFDLLDGADYMDITCSPKALGSGRWADLEIFSFPDMATIEKYVLEVVSRAGSQPCPPVVIGVGIGGTFDYAAKMAKEATLRPIGLSHPEAMVADMERRLLQGINMMGFGPMGTGGDSTAAAVHINYAAGHGFTPVAVAFNCWINRRTRARIYNTGRVEILE